MKNKRLNCFRFGVAGLLLGSNLETKAMGPAGSVSSSRLTNVAGAGGSFLPAFSGDGRSVVFVSHAKNLVTNEFPGPFLNVYVRDLAASNTVLVSVNTTGLGGGNADANFPSISSNGQFVAFASAASNLVNNDTNDAADIFVRDLISGVTTLVSVDSAGGSSAGVVSPSTRYLLSSNPLISQDGRWVVFESMATNLVALEDTNQAGDIFARDLQSGTTYLVSINLDGTGSGNGASEAASLSLDGRFVAFVSTATNLAAGMSSQLGEVYVRDLQLGVTAWASTNVSSFLFGTMNYRCLNPVLSADGRYVAFKASFPGSVILVWHDLLMGVSVLLTRNAALAATPRISADGRFVASERFSDLYLWDVPNSSNTLVSVSTNGTAGGNQVSHDPIICEDGQRVVFLSAATDLSANAATGSSQVYVRYLAEGTTQVASLNLDGSASSGEIDITLPAISRDGQKVLFESVAADLVDNDRNKASDVFLRDLVQQTTDIISRRDKSAPERTGASLTTVFPNSMSADGRVVAFASLDSTLTPNDNDDLQDLFVSDVLSPGFLRVPLDNGDVFSGFRLSLELAMSANGRYLGVGTPLGYLLAPNPVEHISRFDVENGSNSLVSVRLDGAGSANGSSSAPVISSDGNLIAFQSTARDLVSSVFFSVSNVYVRDMVLGTNRMISLNRGGNASGNGDSVSPLLSPDDRWLVFASNARDLLTNDTSGALYLFGTDLNSNVMRMISVGPDSSALGYSHGASFSADSLHVAFVATNSTVAVYDFAGRTSIVACVGCDHPTLSADGRLLAYETLGSGGVPKDIVLDDLRTGSTNLVSRDRLGAGGGNGDSTSPLLSWDGRFVVFASKASNLVENDTNHSSDIFVRDRLLGTTLLVSLNWNATGPGNSGSSQPLLAPDGRTVLFQSFASDLTSGDYNNARDVFLLHLGGPDTDGDGMDDDWEMAYFGTRARDGKGDFDGDGQTDLQEFLAGTDPTNAGSIFRVMTLTSSGGHDTRVIWSATPGRRYQVQFKDNLETTGWNNLFGMVIASGTTGSLLDTSAGGERRRFYRVLLAP